MAKHPPSMGDQVWLIRGILSRDNGQVDVIEKEVVMNEAKLRGPYCEFLQYLINFDLFL